MKQHNSMEAEGLGGKDLLGGHALGGCRRLCPGPFAAAPSSTRRATRELQKQRHELLLEHHLEHKQGGGCSQPPVKSEYQLYPIPSRPCGQRPCT